MSLEFLRTPFETASHPAPRLPCSALKNALIACVAGAVLTACGSGDHPPPPVVAAPKVTLLSAKAEYATGGSVLVDIAPAGLESAVECYLVAMLKGFVLPRLLLQLQPLVIETLGLKATPRLTPGLPFNPAVEQDELRIWLDVDLETSI